jgi:hypothetical protein
MNIPPLMRRQSRLTFQVLNHLLSGFQPTHLHTNMNSNPVSQGLLVIMIHSQFEIRSKPGNHTSPATPYHIGQASAYRVCQVAHVNTSIDVRDPPPPTHVTDVRMAHSNSLPL